MQNIRRIFYTPDEITQDVEKKIREAKQKRELIDYLTFVPDGHNDLLFV